MTARKKAARPRPAATKGQRLDLRARILEAALPDVAFDGWTDALLARAAARLGLAESEVEEAFPAGADDLVRYFSRWADEKMLQKLPPPKLEKMRVRDRITLGVRTRLEILTPYRAAMSAALSFMARPPRTRQLPKMVWQTADAIWRRAGDTSTDYNHYTKRLLLSGVLTSTTLYWLNDDSEGAERSWQFLDNRIDNVLKIGGLLAKARGGAKTRSGA